MANLHSYPAQLPCEATLHSYPAQLPCEATLICYPLRLSWEAVGYLGRLPSEAVQFVVVDPVSLNKHFVLYASCQVDQLT